MGGVIVDQTGHVGQASRAHHLVEEEVGDVDSLLWCKTLHGLGVVRQDRHLRGAEKIVELVAALLHGVGAHVVGQLQGGVDQGWLPRLPLLGGRRGLGRSDHGTVGVGVVFGSVVTAARAAVMVVGFAVVVVVGIRLGCSLLALSLALSRDRCL